MYYNTNLPRTQQNDRGFVALGGEPGKLCPVWLPKCSEKAEPTGSAFLPNIKENLRADRGAEKRVDNLRIVTRGKSAAALGAPGPGRPGCLVKKQPRQAKKDRPTSQGGTIQPPMDTAHAAECLRTQDRQRPIILARMFDNVKTQKCPGAVIETAGGSRPRSAAREVLTRLLSCSCAGRIGWS